jgi:flagellin-like hook-associated protein FlgL
MDFEITTRGGTSFTVDLAGSSTVDDVLTKINAAAVAAGLGGGFSASLATTGNGIQLNDTTGAGTLTVAKLNGSQAADHLGILGSTAGATLVGTDRAKVAVDSVFTHLISLRDALNANDELGIVLAGEKLEADVSRLAAARADAGVRTNRVLDARMREEDLRLQDIGLKAQVQDLDFTDAALRFATLQQQLQAGLTTASRALSLSLIDFIG